MIVDSEGDGMIENQLKIMDETGSLSVDCIISVSSKQASVKRQLCRGACQASEGTISR